MILAIENRSHPAWYCLNCKVSHNILYKDGKESYCEKCVPEEIKEKAILVNQNREIIK